MITAEKAKELFNYIDGEIYWKKQNNRHPIDKPAGYVNSNGYRLIKYQGKQIYAHRLIWIMHGNVLQDQIDHINRNPLDNRIENLRNADYSSNAFNTELRSDNKSGVRGVSWCNTYKKWTVQLFDHKKKITKRFVDLNDAKHFSEIKRKELHGEFFVERRA